ncbi:NAD(P)-dependent benzaldehyde dehydrogenase [Pseudomonas reidholzensis]|uniref:Aldehyde dehydrogenase n=1 Tax=Pseudomonas reidholzensis TaxID=1785162 RepID=A0A383RVR1_9PSED|nr:aldehyde dehydrogenase family protein [Pseudomonas reidholzensis]SYX90995.1 NAD(P)-dependent benzaldehyde dehydrogenase [Pseudomonas reidholzensis]
MRDTSVAQIQQYFSAQKDYFTRGETRQLAFKQRALLKLKAAISAHSEEIFQALAEDLGKDRDQVEMAEIGAVINEIDFALEHLEQWCTPREVQTPAALQPSQSFIHHEPFGVCYIVGPFNYPINLTMLPLIGAIVGGNSALVKPSESTPNAARVIEKIVASAFDTCHVAVIQGGREVNEYALSLALDFIFFTGSPQVGKVVMQAAARQLIPFVLELGGKCPVLVLEDADLDQVAEQIVFGRFFNSGQTCIAPDYVLVPEALNEALVTRLVALTRSLYPQLGSTGKLITARQVQRLDQLLGSSTGRVVLGGQSDSEQRYFAATLVEQVGWDDSLMREELFGPLLPIVQYRDLDATVANINHYHYKPLAAYVFTKDRERGLALLAKIPSGDAQINAVITHSMSPYLPFGGVGPSGIGSYHGEYSFSAFTYQRSIRTVP